MYAFKEYVKQHIRMCMSFEGCNGCPLNWSNGERFCYDAYHSNWTWAAHVVMDWAAEHPEPRYPTWEGWYQECFPDAPLKCPRAFMRTSCRSRYCYECLSEPIPADSAKKLGVKPIE